MTTTICRKMLLENMSKPKHGGRSPKGRDKIREVRARETQAHQERAEKKYASFESYQRRRVFGWTLVALGVLVGVQHLIHHMGFWTLVSDGWDDLLVGYPMAGVLGVAGAIVLS